MNPVHDPLYTIHVRQARQSGKTPLAYADFCARLRGRTDQDLNALLAPHPQGKPTANALRARKFELGSLRVTPNTASMIPAGEIAAAFQKHASGDWGTLGPSDVAQNERALKQGGRLCSRFIATNGQPFWIITDADRSVTTALLPQDY